MASIQRFIEKRLKLKLNAAKSGVRRPEEIKLFGYSFYLNKKGKWLIRISNKSKKKFKAKMAIITNRHRTGSLETIINELVPKLRGWGNYFKLTELKGDFPDLDSWLRTRLRMLIWTRWKRIRTRANYRIWDAPMVLQKHIIIIFLQTDHSYGVENI